MTKPRDEKLILLNKMMVEVADVLYKKRPQLIDVAQVLTQLLAGVIGQAPSELKDDLKKRIIETLTNEDEWGETTDLTEQLTSAKN
jgi:hypothetical protein